jgi:hypothetical protein
LCHERREAGEEGNANQQWALRVHGFWCIRFPPGAGGEV